MMSVVTVKATNHWCGVTWTLGQSAQRRDHPEEPTQMFGRDSIRRAQLEARQAHRAARCERRPQSDPKCPLPKTIEQTYAAAACGELGGSYRPVPAPSLPPP